MLATVEWTLLRTRMNWVSSRQSLRSSASRVCRSTVGGPTVQQLLGAIQPGEHALFVTLGDYSSDAVRIERGKSNLRLISGADLARSIFSNYEKFEPRFKSLLPLKRSYTPSAMPSEAPSIS